MLFNNYSPFISSSPSFNSEKVSRKQKHNDSYNESSKSDTKKMRIHKTAVFSLQNTVAQSKSKECEDISIVEISSPKARPSRSSMSSSSSPAATLFDENRSTSSSSVSSSSISNASNADEVIDVVTCDQHSSSSVFPSSTSNVSNEDDEKIDIGSPNQLMDKINKGLLFLQKKDMDSVKKMIQEMNSEKDVEKAQIDFLKGLIHVMEIQQNPKKYEIDKELIIVKKFFEKSLKELKAYRKANPIMKHLMKHLNLKIKQAILYTKILTLQFSKKTPNFMDIVNDLLNYKIGSSSSSSLVSSSNKKATSFSSSVSTPTLSSSSSSLETNDESSSTLSNLDNTSENKKTTDYMKKFRGHEPGHYYRTIDLLNEGSYSEALENNKKFYDQRSSPSLKTKSIKLFHIFPLLLQGAALFGKAREQNLKSENFEVTLNQAKTVCQTLSHYKTRKITKAVKSVHKVAMEYIISLAEKPITETLDFTCFECFLRNDR